MGRASRTCIRPIGRRMLLAKVLVQEEETWLTIPTNQEEPRQPRGQILLGGTGEIKTLREQSPRTISIRKTMDGDRSREVSRK